MKFLEFLLACRMIYLYIAYPNDIIFKDLKKENVDYELPMINDFSTTDLNSKRQSLIISILSDFSNRSSVKSDKFPQNHLKEENKLGEESEKKLPDIKVVMNKKIRYKEDLFEITTSTYEQIIDNMFLKLRVYISSPKFSFKLKRKLSDFIKLEKSIKSEFARSKYKKKICDNIPCLTRIDVNATPKLKEQIICFELFLNKIINNKVYITEDVLKFLDLDSVIDVKLYNTERKKFVRKNFSHQSLEFQKIDENDDNPNFRESIIKLKAEINNLKIFNKHKIKKVKVADIIISENFFVEKKENSNNLSVEVKINIHYDDQMKTVYKTFKEVEHFVREDTDMLYDSILVHPEDFNKKFFLTNKKDIIQNLNVFFEDLTNKIELSDNFKAFFKEVYLDDYDLKSNYTGNSHQNYNYTFVKNLHKNNQIVSVSVEVASYTLIQNLQFKVQVFYELHFSLKLKNESTDKIIQKYKYKELKDFINKYNIKHGTKLALNSQMFFHKVTEKYFFRQNDLLKALKPIFNNPKIVENSFWIEIFLFDQAYRNLKLVESRNMTPAHSITESMLRQKSII